MSRTGVAHLALLFVAMVYGANYLVAKGLMPQMIGPSGFIVLRVCRRRSFVFWLRWPRSLGNLGKRVCSRKASWAPYVVWFVWSSSQSVDVFQWIEFNLAGECSSIIMTSNPILAGSGVCVLLKTAITAPANCSALAWVQLGAILPVTGGE